MEVTLGAGVGVGAAPVCAAGKDERRYQLLALSTVLPPLNK
jgi:hypothetical protein